MKFTTAAILGFAALLQSAEGTFTVYKSGLSNSLNPPADGWQVYNNIPECGGEINDWLWEDRPDVSGSNRGIRCKGDCARSDNEADIEELELNFSDDKHWTVYKNREWGLFDLSDRKVGSCVPLGNGFYTCGAGDIGRVEGNSKIRCIIDEVNGDDINAEGPPV